MAPVTTDARQKDTLWACLRIAQEAFTEHHFMSMTLNERSLVVGNATAMGKSTVVPKGGNSGELIVYLTRADANKAVVRIENKIRRGPKPICQATRLVDADPVLRKMAEQQILLMGVHAKEYLADRRSKAKSAELRGAIDRIWQRIIASEKPGDLIRPPKRLFRHPDSVVRKMTAMQKRMLPSR